MKCLIPRVLSRKRSNCYRRTKAFWTGICTRKDVAITFANEAGSVTMPLVLFVPTKANHKVPVILLAGGSDIRRMNLALNDSQRFGRTRNGIPLHQLMMRGIGVATVDYEAFGEDDRNLEGKIRGGIIDLFLKPGQESPKDNEWGMIAVWAYALRAGLDYLETDSDVHKGQVATLGCSIGGKVALWAAATDTLFGMTLLSTAGHGGDAIWKREFGETLHNMCKFLPTWGLSKCEQVGQKRARDASGSALLVGDDGSPSILCLHGAARSVGRPKRSVARHLPRRSGLQAVRRECEVLVAQATNDQSPPLSKVQ